MKILRGIIGFIVILILVIFVLSNRLAVAIGFWPFGEVTSLWLGPVVVAVLFLGFLLGLAFHLPVRFAAGRRVKKAEKRNAELEAKLAVPPASLIP